MKPAPPPGNATLTSGSHTKTVWDSRVEGYIILRDLDLYLTKLARDFLLLASKTHVTQQWPTKDDLPAQNRNGPAERSA